MTGALQDIAWKIVRFGGSLLGFSLIWFVASVGAIVWLSTPSSGVRGSDVLGGSAIVGEFVGIGVFAPLRTLRLSKGHIAYSISRPSMGKNPEEVANRLEEAFQELRLHLAWHMPGQRLQAFYLRKIHEHRDIPANEKPYTFDELTQTLALDLTDKTTAEKPPWPTVSAMLTTLKQHLEAENRDQTIRDFLTGMFVEISPWYRQFVISPAPSAFSRFLGSHRDVLSILGPALLFLASLASLAI